jgi:transcription antitermination factor NusG
MNYTYVTSTIAGVAIMFFAVAPTVMLLIGSRRKPTNPKIEVLEATDQAIADQTNEGFTLIAQRLEALEAKVIEISEERKEISGFKN